MAVALFELHNVARSRFLRGIGALFARFAAKAFGREERQENSQRARRKLRRFSKKAPKVTAYSIAESQQV